MESSKKWQTSKVYCTSGGAKPQSPVLRGSLTVSDRQHRSSVEPPGNDALGISFSARTYVLVL